jgi:hypothetical protein
MNDEWNPLEGQIDASTPSGVNLGGGLRVDPAYGGGYSGTGSLGSHLNMGFTSEILQVFIVVDSSKIAGDSLASISSYIAMLTLTRMTSLDGCSELPSIMDLLASSCAERQKPQALTETDSAYLKALYSSDLETNVNFEQVDIRDRMVATLTTRKDDAELPPAAGP